MREDNGSSVALPSVAATDVLSEVLRAGAQRLLTEAVQAEVAEWIESHRDVVDEHGHRLVVRNGSSPQRTILSGLGPIEVQQPRVLDRRTGEDAEPFTSKILPPYLRKTKSVDELIPWLYLKGVSTSDFPEALAALVGVDAPGSLREHRDIAGSEFKDGIKAQVAA
jgi:putative transposase